MSKRLLLKLGAASLTLALLVSGCQKSLNGPDEQGLTELEKQEIKQSIESDPLFTNDGNTLNDDDGSGMTMGKAATPVYPIAWGRRINPDSVNREVTFEQVNDTTVIATVKTTIVGTVIIRAKTLVQADTILFKPFTETITRKIKFYKNPLSIGRRWIHREVSGVEGGTEGSQIEITELRAMFGSDTLVISDPLSYFMRFGGLDGRRVRELPSNFLQTITIQVTVTSSDPDTDFVMLHRPYQMMSPGMFRPLRARMTMTSQTQNGSSYTRVYEKSWTGVVIGRHHVFVSALTKSSIFDDTAAFSSQLWGIPYIVN